jgi:AcrR family transcriptional regulator
LDIVESIVYRLFYALFMAVRETNGAVTPRERHRLQTREEILDAALAVMAEQGVAALNLTEVARRVGLRQPSLYQYFDSRNAVYDALFERGMHAHHEMLTAAITGQGGGWAAVRLAMRETLRFAAGQPVLAQLLFTRTVPGFTPSDRAYTPSLRGYDLVRTAMAAAAERAELHPAAATQDGIALLLALVAGIASQHNANDPGAGFAQSRLIALLDPALDMYAAYFSPDRPPAWTPWSSTG